MSRATWLLFTDVPVPCVALRVRCPGPPGSCSALCPPVVLCRVCGVMGHLAPAHRCARSVRCLACAVSWATWHPFTGVPARCVALRVQCAGPLGSCAPVCSPSVLCCVCGVLGLLAPVHRCAGSVPCVVCAVFPATWALFTCVPARCVLSCGCVACAVSQAAWPLFRRCARFVRCVACTVSWATWLLFNGVLTWCVVSRVRRPGPLGSCSLVCLFSALCCVCGVMGHLAPVQRCACPLCCVACALSCASWLLFTGLLAQCVLLRLCGVPGPFAPVQRSARPVCCVACAVSRATLLLFTDVLPWRVVSRVRCPGPLGLFSPVSLLGVLCFVCGVLGHAALVRRCARFVCSVACAVF